jgi:hypothetical protein
MRARIDLALLILLAGCAKKTESAPDAAPPITSAAPAPVQEDVPRTRAEPREAVRNTIADLSEMRELPADVLSPRFARNLEVQVAELGIGRRRAVLVSSCPSPCRADKADAMVVVLDEANRAVWRKERPVAGITPPAYPLAIAGGPRGRVALAACDPPTKSVALRLWDGDGSPFADYQVLEMETCDAISLLHWPRHGFIVVAATAGMTRARYVSEEGALEWATDLGARSRPDAIAPASLAADTDETFVLVQAVQPSGEKGSPFHALAFRYDRRGQPVWQQAVDLGGVSGPMRLDVEPMKPAGVRVHSRGALDVDLKPSGAFSPRSRAPK